MGQSRPAPIARGLGRLRVATDPLHVALMVLMVLTISRAHQQFPVVAKMRPALSLVVLSFFYAVANPRFLSEKGLLFTWPPKLIAAFAAMIFLSVPFGISAGASGLFVLQSYLPVLVFGGLLIMSVRRASDLYAFIWAFVIGGGILGYFANFVFQLSSYDNGVSRLADMYMYDSNDAGLVLAVSIPLTLLTLQTSRSLGKFASLVFLYWDWMAIARTGSRGAFVGTLAVGIGILFFANSVSIIKRVGFLIAAVLVLVLAAPEGYWKQMQTIMSPTEDYNWKERDGRKQIAERGIQYMLDYPIAGVGVSNFPRAEGTISVQAKNWIQGEAGVRWAAPHNSYIEAGAELGIPGLLIWVSMLVGGIIAPIRLRRLLPRSWRKGAPDERFIYAATMYVPVAMLGFAVSCTFVSFTYMDPVYVLLSFVAGLYVCADSMLTRSPGRAPRRVTAKQNRNARLNAWETPLGFETRS